MVNQEKNIQINKRLKKLYQENSINFIELWRKHYKENPNAQINSFGIIDVESYDTENGVLFIGKETNGWDFEFLPWLTKMAIDNENLDKEDSAKHPQIWYNVGRWAKYIYNPQSNPQLLLSEKKKALSGLRLIAFTNINKIGGYSVSKNSFGKLAEEPLVQKLLQEELNIIEPKIIILCGKRLQNTLSTVKTSAKIIEMPHPSARTNKETLFLQLKEQLKKE